MPRFPLVLALVCTMPTPSVAQELTPPQPAEIAERFLGPAREYGAPGHIIVLTPRAALGTATELGEAIAGRHDAALAASWPLPTLEETCFVLRIPEGADPDAAAEAVMAEAGVLLAYPIQTFATRQSTAASARSEDGADPLVVAQDALRTMRVDAAQEVVTGVGMRVALIDSGVAVDHPDLAGQDVHLRDFVGDGETAERHGTALATLIAADATNGIGMAGVAPDVELMALRACHEEDGAGRCNTFSLALALDHAVVGGADVVNLSIGGPPDRLLAALVARAQERGALVVAADGEAGFPVGLPDVVAVGPIETGGESLLAPGLEVLSAEPSGGWDFFTGPSVASAHAAGVAALLWSGRPGATAGDIRAALGRGTLDACAGLDALGAGAGCE